MNILLLSWKDPKHPLSGGAEQVSLEHTKYWVEHGHKVTWFSSKFKGAQTHERINNLRIIRGGSMYLGVRLRAWIYYLNNSERFDLVIDQFHGLPFFTPIYVKKPKLAVIHEVAGPVWFLNRFIWPLDLLIGLIGFICEKIAFRFYKSTHFITVSSSTAKDLVGHGIPKRNISIIYNGISKTNLTVKVVREKIFTAVFLGILSKDKGILDAIRCFSILEKRGEFQFWVIGKSETESFDREIKKLAKKLGIDQKIKFLGFISDRKKFELLNKAHLLINPSAKEGWGLVNLEANSVGTPVVGYKNGGLINSIKNNFSGLLCKHNTPQDLADNIIKLKQDKKRYLRLQKGARIWSKRFSWGKSSYESLKVVERVTNG